MCIFCTFKRRSPHGERGLKLQQLAQQTKKVIRRSPHGERGLKYPAPLSPARLPKVAPRTGSVD